MHSSPAIAVRLVRLFAVPVLLGLMAVLNCAAANDNPALSARPTYYRLHPMDLLKVQVFDQPDLDREVRVTQDHTVVMPLIGSVDLRNMTVRDAEQVIKDLYQKDYLVSPQINITILEYAPRTVNVFGAINSPGAVSIPPEHNSFSLLDAVAKAGGFSRMANRGRLSLTRISPEGQAQNYTIDADKLLDGDTTNRWPMQDGDVIYVPEKVL